MIFGGSRRFPRASLNSLVKNYLKIITPGNSIVNIDSKFRTLAAKIDPT